MSDVGRRVGRAALLVAAGVLISRVLGFLRDVVIADLLGDSPAADAYTAAFILPNFLNYLLAGGFLAITFIPILSGYLARGDEPGASAAFGAVFRPVAVAIVVLTGAAMLLAEPVVELLFGGEGRLAAAQVDEVTRLTRLVLPAQIFFVLGGLYTAVQYASGRFLIPTLAPIVYNAGIILGGLLGTGESGTATGFIVGAVVGAFIGNFVLQWFGARATGLISHRGPLRFTDSRFREYLVLAIPLMVGQSIVVLDESLGSIFAALADPGSIYALNLARRVNMLPIGVIAQAAGVAAYPYLARLVAEGRLAEMRETMGRTIRSVVVVSGMAVAAVIAISQPLIRVAFQHGEFSAAGTVLTAAALIGYSLSIPAWGIHQILARAFYAHRQMWVPVVAGTAWTLIAIPLFLVGFDRYGVIGLAVASSTSVTGYALTLAWLWRRRHSVEGMTGTARTLARTALVAAPAAVVGWLAAGLVGSGPLSLAEGLGSSLAGLVAVVAVYAGGTWLIRAPELTALLRR